jgi:hypothetical protein
VPLCVIRTPTSQIHGPLVVAIPCAGTAVHRELRLLLLLASIAQRADGSASQVHEHKQQKASKNELIGAQKRGSAITDPTQWLLRANKWLEMRWWHFQLSKNPPSWPFNGHITR